MADAVGDNEKVRGKLCKVSISNRIQTGLITYRIKPNTSQNQRDVVIHRDHGHIYRHPEEVYRP